METPDYIELLPSKPPYGRRYLDVAVVCFQESL